MATELGPYKLLRRIASGGMGEVYLAVLKRDGGFSKTVALKTLLPSLSRQPNLAHRFEQEAACAAVLNHPNIVQVFDHGQAEGISYLTMEFVEGPSLDELLLNTGSKPFPPEVAAEIGVQLCRALGHAHERMDMHGHPVGIIHGDVSPSNILLSMDGTVKLADFGLSRIIVDNKSDGTISGKLSYMSPEQANAEVLEATSDIFSLGLVLFEMFTGKKAFPQAEPVPNRLERIKEGKRQSIHEASENRLDDAICLVVEKALYTDRALRYQRTSDMAQELSRVISPCGPDRLAEFVSSHTPKDHISTTSIPEPTQVASAPLGHMDTTQQEIGKHWLVALLAIIIVAWAAGFGWWYFHEPIHTRPKPPINKLPRAPADLRVRMVSVDQAAWPEKTGTTNKEKKHMEVHQDIHSGINTVKPHGPRKHDMSRVPVGSKSDFPPHQVPCMIIDLPKATAVSLDHVPVRTKKLHIKTRAGHLLKLRPKHNNEPEVLIRFQPTSDKKTWEMTVSSEPWMRIFLNRRPSGQTPKTGLLIPRQGGHLELSRNGFSMRLFFSPMLDDHK